MNSCPYESEHYLLGKGNVCICGFTPPRSNQSSWRGDFKKGEQFQIKGTAFEVANVGRRGLALRKVNQ